MGWERYQDANTLPTSPLADDLATAPSVPVCFHLTQGVFYMIHPINKIVHITAFVY